MTPEVLRGDIHGFILYRASHVKPHDRPWATNDEIQAEDYAQHIPEGRTHPLQMSLPHALYTTSEPEPLLTEQAASRLFTPQQSEFAAIADDATRHYLNLSHLDGKPEHFTHLHGIGSWEHHLEPSMMTVFHRPMSPEQLHAIGLDAASLAGQEGVLAFHPNPAGRDQLAHLRFPSHSSQLKQLDPGTVGEIVDRVLHQFEPHHVMTASGRKEYLMPGRSIFPDAEGHTDVITHIPEHVSDADRGRTLQALNVIAHQLGGNLQTWGGTAHYIGGEHPYSMSEETAEPYQFARSPAKTGIVVRGVFYKPGAIIPDLISPKEEEKAKLSRDEFKAKLRIAFNRRKREKV